MTTAGVGADAQAAPICPIEACEPDTSIPCNDIGVPVTVGFKTHMVCNVDVTGGTDGDATAYAVANAASATSTPCDAYETCAFGNDDSAGEDHLVAGLADDVRVGGDNPDWLDGGPGMDECAAEVDDTYASCDAMSSLECGADGVIECPI